MRLLLINPNTSEHITERMRVAARAILPDEIEITAITGEFGARVVSSRADAAVAGHAALELARKHRTGHDAVVLGISLDCGLQALREELDLPVVAMTQAGLATALLLGPRAGFVTLGSRMLPIYRDLVESYRLEAMISAWCAPDLPGLFSAESDPQSEEALGNAIARMLEDSTPDSIILSGAVLSGRAPALRRQIAVPLVDCLESALLHAVTLARLGLRIPAQSGDSPR